MCGCTTTEDEQRRNLQAYRFGRELTDERGRPDGGFSLLLNGYWPRVPGRPWVFDGVQAPNVPDSAGKSREE